MPSTDDELAALWALARQDDPHASADDIAAAIVERMGRRNLAWSDVRRFVDDLERSDDEWEAAQLRWHASAPPTGPLAALDTD